MIFPFDAWKGGSIAWLWTNWMQLVNEYDGVGALEKTISGAQETVETSIENIRKTIPRTTLYNNRLVCSHL